MINLIQNAVKFSEPGKKVVVSLKSTFLSHSDVKLEIKVIDWGIGIQNNDFSRLFDPYFKSSNILSQTMNAGGHGVGLYTSKKIIEMLGGTLEVVSTF